MDHGLSKTLNHKPPETQSQQLAQELQNKLQVSQGHMTRDQGHGTLGNILCTVMFNSV